MNIETKNCQNCKKDFTIEPDDFSFYEKIKVPAPTFCPMCRLQRRMTWRNERYLFRRKCGKTGKEIFSGYHPSAPVNPWGVLGWYKDDWDQNMSGRDYDFTKPFFSQFAELLKIAPIPSRTYVQPVVNSDYCNNFGNAKNCYLVFGSMTTEDCNYSENMARSKNCTDCSLCSDCEFCYEGFFNHRSYSTLFSSYCEDCLDVSFCKDCVGCSDCLGCVNLKNKKYYIFNEPYSKEEYKEKIKIYNLENYEGLQKFRKLFVDFRQKFPVRFTHSFKNKQCQGEYITNSKNVKQSYYIDGGEDLKYCHMLYSKPTKDSYDQYQWGNNSELMYECTSSGGSSSQCRFCQQVYNNSFDVQYSFVCINATHCFGCVGLRKKEYCILNKQYTKEEYDNLIPKIIKHMDEMPYIDNNDRIYKYGEFFPTQISPFAYNETRAHEFFPLKKEEVVSQGFLGRNIERKNYQITLQSQDVPNKILEAQDSIFSEIIECEHIGLCSHECTKVFKIIPQELQFYQRLNVPIPHLCPQCRFFERRKQMNEIPIYSRICDCGGVSSKKGEYQNTIMHFHGSDSCPNEFETSYSPDRPEIVYCEKCYQQEVI